MGKQPDKTLALLTLLSKLGTPAGSPGGGCVQMAQIKTAEPDDVSIVLTGTNLALDLDLFEVPVDMYPLRAGDKFLALPIGPGDTGRWALISKLNCGQVMATMRSATSMQPDGMQVTYGADRVIAPAAVLNTDGGDVFYRALRSGDRVSIAPTMVDKTIKYAVLNIY